MRLTVFSYKKSFVLITNLFPLGEGISFLFGDVDLVPFDPGVSDLESDDDDDLTIEGVTCTAGLNGGLADVDILSTDNTGLVICDSGFSIGSRGLVLDKFDLAEGIADLTVEATEFIFEIVFFSIDGFFVMVDKLPFSLEVVPICPVPLGPLGSLGKSWNLGGLFSVLSCLKELSPVL